MKRFQDFKSNEQGAIAIWLAGGMSALIGMGALTVDVSNLYVQETRLQIAGDTAALAAMSVLGEGEQAVRDVAIDYVEKNLPSAYFGTVLVAQDVVTGMWDEGTASFTPAAGSTNAVQLTLRRTSASGNPVSTFLAGVVGYNSMDIVTQVTATAAPGQPGCILALDPTSMSDALRITSIVSVELNDCVPAANSTDDKAIKISSVDMFHAGSLYTVGDFYTSSTVMDLDEPAQVDQDDPVPDPYGGLPDPSPGACDYDDNATMPTISPGVYCNGLVLSGSGGALTVQPGTYYIVGGKLQFNSMSSITCDCSEPGSGVTFVITGDSPGDIKEFEISGIGSVSLRAPSDPSYDFPGVLIYVDRRAPYATSKFNTIDNLTLNGALYAPSQLLQINSILYTAETDCAWTVAYHVAFSGVGSFGRTDNCSAYGTRSISVGGSSGGPRLVQ